MEDKLKKWTSHLEDRPLTDDNARLRRVNLEMGEKIPEEVSSLSVLVKTNLTAAGLATASSMRIETSEAPGKDEDLELLALASSIARSMRQNGGLAAVIIAAAEMYKQENGN